LERSFRGGVALQFLAERAQDLQLDPVLGPARRTLMRIRSSSEASLSCIPTRSTSTALLFRSEKPPVPLGTPRQSRSPASVEKVK
jgi:hypothetical protein